MKFNKVNLFLYVVATLLAINQCCTGNDLRMANIDYVQKDTGKKMHYGFKYRRTSQFGMRKALRGTKNQFRKPKISLKIHI